MMSGSTVSLVILTPQGERNIRDREEIVSSKIQNDPCLMDGGGRGEGGQRALEKGNIPTYRTPEDAERCFMLITNTQEFGAPL